MIHRYFDGAVPAPPDDSGGVLAALASETIGKVRDRFEAFQFSRGLEAIWALIGAVDKYLVEQKPWVLIKGEDEATQAQLRATLYNAAEVLRIVTALVSPVLPKSAAEIWRQLGQETDLKAVRYDSLVWGQLQPGTKLPGGEAVFPRLDKGASIKKMEELEQEVLKEQAEIMGKTAEVAADVKEKPAESEHIEITDFAKVEMRVGVVKSAEKVKKADKLLHLTVDIGEAEPRSIVAGIAGAYEPDSLIGAQGGDRGEPQAPQAARFGVGRDDYRGFGGRREAEPRKFPGGCAHRSAAELIVDSPLSRNWLVCKARIEAVT